MPNHISFVIPCESQWVEGIYQLECSDMLGGYDPNTGTDGVSNQQAKELGDRTLYLRDLIAAEHTDGHHTFTASDFADTTKIPESALQLNYPTQELHDLIAALRNDITAADENVTNLTDVNLSYTSILTILMPYSAEYFKTHTSYELFNDVIKLRSFGYTTIAREIAGDDSLDVASTEGIEVGKTYFLMDTDGSNIEEVVVLSVLNNNRIRFTSDLTKTRTSGYMAATTLLPQEGKATVFSGFAYVTDTIETFVGAESGRLYVHRDNVEATANVYYCIEGSSTWRPAEYVGKDNFYDGTIDDVFSLPAARLKLRIEYSNCVSSFNLYYFVVKGIHSYIAVEDIRRPKITDVTLTGDTLTVTGDTYASLWGLQYASTVVRVLDDIEYPTVRATGSSNTNVVAVTLPAEIVDKRPLYVQLRYTDIEGTQSRWSVSYIMADTTGE